MLSSQYFLRNKLSACVRGLNVLAEHQSAVDNIEKVFPSSKKSRFGLFFGLDSPPLTELFLPLMYAIHSTHPLQSFA